MKTYILLKMDWNCSVSSACKVTAATPLDAAFQNVDFANEVKRIKIACKTKQLLDEDIIFENSIEGFTAVYSVNECLVGLIEV